MNPDEAPPRDAAQEADIDVRPVYEAELALVAELVAAQQADPARHVGIVGSDAPSIVADLRALEPLGLGGVLVAVGGDGVAGVLGAEWDVDPPRVWWHGPFVLRGDFDEVGGALLDAGERLLPAAVTQREIAPDERNVVLAGLAARRGYAPEEASAVLVRALEPSAPAVVPSGVTVTAMREPDRAAVAVLHDALFPGTHLPGHRIDEGDDRVVLVARRSGDVVGYIAAERDSDGSGYIDFLGVAPQARGAGIGGALVGEVSSVLARVLGCRVANLTVRESNTTARRLYERHGFTQERLLRPWRRGFPATDPAAPPPSP